MSAPDPEGLATGLIRIDGSGRIDWINRAAAEWLGRSASLLKGQPMAQACPVLAGPLERQQRVGGSVSLNELELSDQGPNLDVFIHASEQGILIELHAIAERLRQRRRAERADRQQGIALLARGLAHELRNPLAGVRGAAQLIERGKDTQAIQRHARMIQREVDRITGLIEHVAGKRDLDLVPVNLHQIMDEALELVQAESGGQLDIRREFDPSIPVILADQDRLHQLLLNLLRNSCQAGAQHLRVASRIEHDCALIDPPSRHAVRLDLDDDGHGVPENLRDRLFLPLISGREQGSGFGLAMVQQIARAHGGLVDYRALESGSRFSLRLPLRTP